MYPLGSDWPGLVSALWALVRGEQRLSSSHLLASVLLTLLTGVSDVSDGWPLTEAELSGAGGFRGNGTEPGMWPGAGGPGRPAE